MATNNALNNNLVNCSGLIPSTGLNASGTPSSTTILYGNNTWGPVPTVALLQASVTYTITQIIASKSSPLSFIASVPGKIIVPINAQMIFNYGGVALSTSNPTFQFTYTATAGVIYSQVQSLGTQSYLCLGFGGNPSPLPLASLSGSGISFATTTTLTNGTGSTFQVVMNYYLM